MPTRVQLSPEQAAQVQAILLQQHQQEEEEPAALLDRAGQRLGRLRACLLDPNAVGGGGGGHVRPPLIQSILESIPSALDPEQTLRALEWFDANREGVAALPCLPSEAEEWAAAFHFSSAEDTPLLRQWGEGGGGV